MTQSEKERQTPKGIINILFLFRSETGTINMSDDNSPVVEEQKKKRGRPAKTDKNAVKEGPKKRGRPAVEKNNAVRPSKSDNEDDAPPGPVKKGRGRPKGSHKKKVNGA